MRKILAMLILGCAAVVHAQVIGLNPTPQAIYFWNTATNAWTPCSNSSTAEPFASTPQAFTQEGFNTALGQWTPSTSCPSGMSNGITSFQGRTTSAAVLLLSDVTPVLQSATNCNVSGSFVYSPVSNSCILSAASGTAGGALAGTYPNPTIAGIGAAGLIPASDGAGNLVPATDAQKTTTLGITPLILGGTKTAVDGMTSLTFGTSGSTGFTSIGQGEATIDSFSIFPIGLTLTGFSTFGTHATIVDRNLGNTWYFGVDGTNQLASEGNYVITNDPMWDTNQFEVGASGVFLPYISSGLCLQTTGSHGQIVGAACGGTVGVPVDVTGSRTFGPGNIYQNTNAFTLQASGFGVAVTGSATNNISCLVGPTSPPTMIVWGETNGATTAGGAAGFICPRIPATWFYEVNKTNDLSATPSSWIESPTI